MYVFNYWFNDKKWNNKSIYNVYITWDIGYLLINNKINLNHSITYQEYIEEWKKQINLSNNFCR